MKNLLKETIEDLRQNGKNENDVKWVGSIEFGQFAWEEFKALANIEYDSSYGAPEVATDLIIVGKNWWLERHEYDGSEWWEFKQLPKKPSIHKMPSRLIINEEQTGWETLSTINN